MYMQMIFFKELLSEEKDGIANILFEIEKQNFHLKHSLHSKYTVSSTQNTSKKATKDKHLMDRHKQGGVVLRVSRSFLHKPFA